MLPGRDQIPAKAAIIPFYFTAAVCFLVVSILCFIAAPVLTGHFFQPKVLAITHLAILGWYCMVIFGASNQLMPVITEQKLYSEKMPVAVLVFLILGTLGLVSSFWNFAFTWVAFVGGIFILTAFLLHAINIFNTAVRASRDISTDLILTAHIWLVLTAIIGFTLLANLRFPFLPNDHLSYLKVHASIGMAGWFVQLVMGVSAKLVPMFILSAEQEKKPLNLTFYTVNAGLALFFLNGMTLRMPWVPVICLLLLAVGIGCYLRYIFRCYKSTLRPKLEPAMKQTFIAIGLVLLPFLLMSVLSFSGRDIPSLVTAYGFSFFAGFINVIIMAQTFKTLPYIVWMHLVRPDELPKLMPKDLVKEGLLKWQIWIYIPAFFTFLVGIISEQQLLNYIGAGLMVCAASIYFIHVCLILKKLTSSANRH